MSNICFVSPKENVNKPSFQLFIFLLTSSITSKYKWHVSIYENAALRLHTLPKVRSESYSVLSDSLQLHGLYSPWNSPGQNSGMGSLSFLQEIFPTQESNPGLLHCRQILYQLNHQGSPSLPNWVFFPKILLSWSSGITAYSLNGSSFFFFFFQIRWFFVFVFFFLNYLTVFSPSGLLDQVLARTDIFGVGGYGLPPKPNKSKGLFLTWHE